MKPFALLALFQIFLIGFSIADRLPGIRAPDVPTIPHNKIKVQKETTSPTQEQSIAIMFKPMIKIENGCDVYPAIDPFTGLPSGGLQGTGNVDGSCRTDKSQIYGRTKWLNFKKGANGLKYGDLAIMTAFYFPKFVATTSTNSSWRKFESNRIRQDRHMWQNVVMCVRVDDKQTASLVGLALKWDDSPYSGFTREQLKKDEMKDTHPKLKVAFRETDKRLGSWRPLDGIAHLALTGHKGRNLPYMFWEDLKPEVQQTLNTYHYGWSLCPLADSVFEDHIAEANKTMIGVLPRH